MTRNDLKRQAEKEWETNPLLKNEPTTAQQWWATCFHIQMSVQALEDNLQKIKREIEYDEVVLRGVDLSDRFNMNEKPLFFSFEDAQRFNERLEEAKAIVDEAFEKYANKV